MNDHLSQTLDAIVEESKAVREAATAAERARKKQTRIILAVAILGVILLVGLAWMAFQTQNLAETITSCTTPGGKCYQQSQSRTGEVVQLILDGQVATQECRDEVDIQACVESKLLEP